MSKRETHICKNCGEGIHINSFEHRWFHWDGYTNCLDAETVAEPKEASNAD
jgi:hypothetical protein